MAITIHYESETPASITNLLKPASPELENSPDLIEQVEVVIGSCSAKEALANTEQVVDQRGINAYVLGALLERIKGMKWFAPRWPSFSEYVESSLGVSKSSAYHCISIYKSVKDSGIQWSSIKEIGWVKINIIKDKLSSADASEWIEMAKKLTVKDLQAACSQPLPIEGTSINPNQQKTQNATLSSQLENPASTTSYADNVNPGINSATKEVDQATDEPTSKNSFVAAKYSIPTDSINIIEDAIAFAMNESGTDHRGTALVYVCQQFVMEYSPGTQSTSSPEGSGN